MSRLRYNNVENTLGAALSSGGTVITFTSALAYNNGLAVPTVSGADYIPLSIDTDSPAFEIVWLTAYTSGATTGTITRGQDGTTGISHNINATVQHAPNTVDFTAPFITGSLAGDLSGTLASSTVAKVQGVSQTAATSTILSGLAGATTRSATATLVAGEQTVYTGSTGSQTLTLPATPQVSTVNVVLNLASVNVTLAAGAGNTLNNLGTVGSITVLPNQAYEVVFIGTVWYVFAGKGSISGAAGGDLSGTYPNPTVAAIQGVAQTSGTATILSHLTGATTRSATATLVAGEQTVFTGSTASQTLTLPATPQVSSINTVTNLATVAVTLAAGSGNTVTNILGTTGSITVQPSDTYQIVFVGTTWYILSSDTLSTSSYTPNHATATTPVFVSGTALQINASQDVMLYMTTTSASNPTTITLGPTTGAENTIRASANYGTGNMFSMRVPASWRVVITGTISSFTFLAVTC